MAAAQSSKIHNIPLPEEDLSCPVCFDELGDPKSLPACAHIVCKECLEKMAAKSDDQCIECPTCKKKSRIPEDGVDGFATNHLMRRMVDHIPGRKEKLELQKALKDCEDKINDGISTVKSINKQIQDAEKMHLKRVENVKHEISEHARKLKEVVEEEKIRLLLEVDESTKCSLEVLRLKKRKKELLERIKQTEDCATNVSEHLKKNCLEDIRELKEVLVNNLQEHSQKILRPVPMRGLEGNDSVVFNQNMKMFAERNLLGSFSKSTTKTNVNKDKKNPEEVHSIDPLSIDLNFEPLSIAVSASYGKFEIGVLRSDEKKLDIFNIHGKHTKSVQLDAVPATHLYDLYFSTAQDIILVADLADKQLLNYSFDGRCRKSNRVDESIKFISLDERNRIIMTTSHDEKIRKPCSVLVYHPHKDEPHLRFGESNLVSPSGRAVCLKNTFYVPDNYSDLKIFDQKGIYIRCAPLDGVNPQDYNIFAIDVYQHSIIACNCNTKFVKIFSVGDFSLISTLRIPDAPWMIDALPSCTRGKCRLAVIYDNGTRLDIIGE